MKQIRKINTVIMKNKYGDEITVIQPDKIQNRFKQGDVSYRAPPNLNKKRKNIEEASR